MGDFADQQVLNVRIDASSDRLVIFPIQLEKVPEKSPKHPLVHMGGELERLKYQSTINLPSIYHHLLLLWLSFAHNVAKTMPRTPSPSHHQFFVGGMFTSPK